MKKSEIITKVDCLEDAIQISKQIPEFDDVYFNSKYKNRLKDKKHLILTAYKKNKPVGFKIGYETPSKQYLYSWIGGVIPKYRKLGIAEKLLEYQERWAAKAGYKRILVKTRSKYLGMIKFLEKHNYLKMGIIPFNPNDETRILYDKKL